MAWFFLALVVTVVCWPPTHGHDGHGMLRGLAPSTPLGGRKPRAGGRAGPPKASLPPPYLTSQRVKDLVANMSLEDKVGQMGEWRGCPHSQG